MGIEPELSKIVYDLCYDGFLKYHVLTALLNEFETNLFIDYTYQLVSEEVLAMTEIMQNA